MKVYYLAYGNDRLIFESQTKDLERNRRVLGAFVPGTDGNYYQQVIVGFVGEGERQFTPGMEAWWRWCKESIEQGDTLIDDEFPFDPEEVRIITSEVDLA